jgi:hypothetical protein
MCTNALRGILILSLANILCTEIVRAEESNSIPYNVAQENGQYTVDESIGAQSDISTQQNQDLYSIIRDRILKPVVDGSAFKITIRKPALLRNSALYELDPNACPSFIRDRDKAIVVSARVDLKPDFLREVEQLMEEVGTPINNWESAINPVSGVCRDENNKSCVSIIRNASKGGAGRPISNWKLQGAWVLDGNFLTWANRKALLESLGTRLAWDSKGVSSGPILEIKDEEGFVLVKEKLGGNLADGDSRYTCTTEFVQQGSAVSRFPTNGFSSDGSPLSFASDSWINMIQIITGRELSIMVLPRDFDVGNIKTISLHF